MRWFRTFVGGILAGISIAIGGTVFLSLENKVLGALFFTVGLFAVCTFGFNLFTGKVCYVFDQDRKYALGLPLIWLGNLAGAFGTAMAERATRVGPALAEKAQAICRIKLGKTEGAMEDLDWVLLHGTNEELFQTASGMMDQLMAGEIPVLDED